MKFVTKKQLEERLERARQRYACQQERLETLLLSMQNNEDNIRQMEYVLNMIDRIGSNIAAIALFPVWKWKNSLFMLPVCMIVFSIICTYTILITLISAPLFLPAICLKVAYILRIIVSSVLPL